VPPTPDLSDPPSAEPYDALLLVSFGGPEQAADVMPFLENVTRGRGITQERLEQVGEHYFALGGRSPINDQNRALVAAVEADFASHGVDIPVYWGNRNWDPYLADTIAKMSADGVRRAACFVTSAYASYSGCRQYRENLFDALTGVEGPPRLDKLRHYFNHPGFIEANVEETLLALDRLPPEQHTAARLVFVTHSIPTGMADTSGPNGGAYVAQHLSVADLVADAVATRTGTLRPWDLVYCSRSGPPQTAWLEPDINDHLGSLAERGVETVVVVPIGFVSDHMEVVYDLDTEAAATAARLGMTFERARTAGTHPAFVTAVRDLLVERASVERGTPLVRRALGELGPAWNLCAPHCCPNPREPRPALCEEPT
jgi:ferrochelatase